MSHLVVHITGARPNFPKAAPVIDALARQATAAGKDVRQVLVHTGQHYDERLSDVFFRQLGLPEPDVNLGVGSGSHAEQTAAVMVGLERLFLEDRPDLVVVYGDVNSTVAAALVAAKLQIPLAHVEAGLRSFDPRCPRRSTGWSPTGWPMSCSAPAQTPSPTWATRAWRPTGSTSSAIP
jgi:UDP-N-acetylglucosamine 2-epimerase (non-hydrolysing)